MNTEQLNNLYIYCSDCGEDITLDPQYYDLNGKVYCDKCNEFHDTDEEE